MEQLVVKNFIWEYTQTFSCWDHFVSNMYFTASCKGSRGVSFPLLSVYILSKMQLMKSSFKYNSPSLLIFTKVLSSVSMALPMDWWAGSNALLAFLPLLWHDRDLFFPYLIFFLGTEGASFCKLKRPNGKRFKLATQAKTEREETQVTNSGTIHANLPCLSVV